MSHFANIVVGSGPGGATTAFQLAMAGREVLVLEEGRGDEVVPYTPQEMQSKYRNGGVTATLGKPLVQYVEGVAVGGGSEVNSGLYHRLPKVIQRHWEEEFLFAKSDLDEHFQAVEEELSVSLTPGKLPPASLKLAEGAEALGWSFQEVPRWHKYEKRGTGVRQTMSRTYLRWAVDSGKAQLRDSCRVVKLEADGKVWRVYDACGVCRTADHVFVACGAVFTPWLLKRSGISQRIGKTLSLHPTLKLTALFPEQVNDEEMGVCVHQVKEFAPQMSFGCSISQPGHLALAGLDQPALLSLVRSSWRRMAIYYVNVLGTSHGKVSCLPGSPDPVVSYEVTERELRELSVGLKRLGRLLFAAGAQKLFPSVVGQSPFTRPHELETLAPVLPRANTRLMTVHLFGSCPAGEAEKCPVDSFGNLKGYPGLHIHDASALCSAPGVNPQGSIMAVARRNTLKFLEDGA